MSKPTCGVGGCDRPVRARDWCEAHYDRWRATGDVRAGIPVRKRQGSGRAKCAVPECLKPVKASGWCENHARKWRRWGDPLGGRSRRIYPVGTPCKVDGCDEPVSARGWCKLHYARWVDRSRRGTPGDPGVPRQIVGDDLARFWSKVDKNGPVPSYRPALGPCWIWTAAINKRSGYGYFAVGGLYAVNRNRGAHRYSYELAKGRIPRGLEIDHLCRVRHCVNPAHLEAVTPQENRRRAARALWELRDNKCANGHEMTPENTLIICATCTNEHDRRRRKPTRSATLFPGAA